MPDLVYPLRADTATHHQELRYSLRAAQKNLPHGCVWFVGTKRPRWAAPEALFIKVSEKGMDKWHAIPNAYRAACAEPEVSDRFILMNDDFFVMEPAGVLPVYHRGLVVEGKSWDKRVASSYQQGYRDTVKLLEQIGVPRAQVLNYELHLPMPVAKEPLAETLQVAAERFRGRILQTRTLYGNMWGVGGEQRKDVKVFRQERNGLDLPFLSTNDQSFGNYVGKMIRAAFPEPSRYEREDR